MQDNVALSDWLIAVELNGVYTGRCQITAKTDLPANTNRGENIIYLLLTDQTAVD